MLKPKGMVSVEKPSLLVLSILSAVLSDADVGVVIMEPRVVRKIGVVSVEVIVAECGTHGLIDIVNIECAPLVCFPVEILIPDTAQAVVVAVGAGVVFVEGIGLAVAAVDGDTAFLNHTPFSHQLMYGNRVVDYLHYARL